MRYLLINCVMVKVSKQRKEKLNQSVNVVLLNGISGWYEYIGNRQFVFVARAICFVTLVWLVLLLHHPTKIQFWWFYTPLGLALISTDLRPRCDCFSHYGVYKSICAHTAEYMFWSAFEQTRVILMCQSNWSESVFLNFHHQFLAFFICQRHFQHRITHCKTKKNLPYHQASLNSETDVITESL